MSGKPKSIGNILSELMARRGYARVIAAGVSAEAWRRAAGEALPGILAPDKRGVACWSVCDYSTLAQENDFRKTGDSGAARRIAARRSDSRLEDPRRTAGLNNPITR